MGRFANDRDGVGVRIHPDSSYGDSGFSAMGKPIPFFRKEAANTALKDMGVDDAERRWACITGVSDKLERDQPHSAMELAYGFVDATGCYRLIATLLAAENNT